MSTFLQLCQSARQECGIAGTGPTAVTAQTGELKRVVDWVKQAWIEIQNRHLGQGEMSWRWMRVPFTLTTVANDFQYAPTDAEIVDDLTATQITRFSHWHLKDPENPLYIYKQSAGVGTETWMVYIDYESYRWLYLRGTQNAGYPIHIAINPQDNLMLGQKPDDVYVITGEYFRSAQVLAADGDTPEMPSQYHELIVYRAMEKYGYHEGAPEVLARGQVEGDAMMRQLENNQLPRIATAEPMA